MQVSVESSKGLERKMTVHVPAERVNGAIDTRLKQLGKTANIKGFRKGKVPFSVIKQQYGPQVRDEVMRDLLNETYVAALDQEKLQPAGGPTIDPVSMDDNGLKYTATFEIYPEVELKKKEGLKVEKPVVEITDEDMQRMITNLQKQRGELQIVERAAAQGDQVVIDFKGDLKGKEFNGGSGSDVAVEIGSERMIPGFEDELVGLKAGDEKEFDIKFPKDYPSEEVAGKKAHFAVKVKSVSELKLPELDDEFCQSFGVAEGGIEKLKSEVRDNMERELKETVRRKVKEQLLDALVEANKVDLPAALVDQEIQGLQRDALQRMGLTNISEAPELPRDLFEEQARRRVSLGLLIGKVIEENQVQLDRARVDQVLADITESYEDPDQVMAAYRSNANMMRTIESMVLEDQAVDTLLDKAKVTEKPSSFSEVMKFGPGK